VSPPAYERLRKCGPVGGMRFDSSNRAVRCELRVLRGGSSLPRRPRQLSRGSAPRTAIRAPSESTPARWVAPAPRSDSRRSSLSLGRWPAIGNEHHSRGPVRCRRARFNRRRIVLRRISRARSAFLDLFTGWLGFGVCKGSSSAYVRQRFHRSGEMFRNPAARAGSHGRSHASGPGRRIELRDGLVREPRPLCERIRRVTAWTAFHPQSIEQLSGRTTVWQKLPRRSNPGSVASR
jgi:hypothetical protein